ncbi:transcriptional regulator [Rhodospirillum rubrum]|uniref:PAS domain-containing protein n=1 Tax=Rhodospirillum rubrum TaxID=1085 RepID=UPI0019064C08|nr:PAS domain-containing protein [Rhodospirillum rubrum]MBK1663824.1 transcriptional regulator [Rhodospirillum rubrum]MBK1675837.1 transcriptional regulator [Rhodospirillum rubrum]
MIDPILAAGLRDRVLTRLAHRLPFGLVVTQAGGAILYANPRFAHQIGQAAETLIGRSLAALCPDLPTPTPGLESGRMAALTGADGRMFGVIARVVPASQPPERPSWIWTFEDGVDLPDLERALDHLLSHSPTTGLPAQARFLKEAADLAGAEGYGLAVIGFTGFTRLQSTVAGALEAPFYRHLAATLAKEAPHRLIGQITADTFALFCPTGHDAALVAQRVVGHLCHGVVLGEVTLPLDCLGIGRDGAAGADPALVLEDALVALKAAEAALPQRGSSRSRAPFSASVST